MMATGSLASCGRPKTRVKTSGSASADISAIRWRFSLAWKRTTSPRTLAGSSRPIFVTKPCQSIACKRTFDDPVNLRLNDKGSLPSVRGARQPHAVLYVDMGAPAACPFKIATICSSLNRPRFISAAALRRRPNLEEVAARAQHTQLLPKDNLPSRNGNRILRLCGFRNSQCTDLPKRGLAAMEKRTIDVAIASPFDLWCMGMEKLIADLGWKTSRRCSNAKQLLNLTRTTQLDFLIVAKSVLDYVDIEEYLDQFREYSPAKILVILEPDDTLSSLNMSILPIDGLILSTATRRKFDECLLSVLDGARWIDEKVLKILELAQFGLHRIGDLSRREFEVARLAASGLSNKQIGRILEVSDGTIKVHMHHILSKLNLGSRIDLSWSAPDLFSEPDEEFGKQPFHRALTRH